jgi:hypothetical protein
MSFLTALMPAVSHANLVIFNLSSAISTRPRKIAVPSKTITFKNIYIHIN